MRHILVCVWVWTVGNSLFRYIVTKAKKKVGALVTMVGGVGGGETVALCVHNTNCL